MRAHLTAAAGWSRSTLDESSTTGAHALRELRLPSPASSWLQDRLRSFMFEMAVWVRTFGWLDRRYSPTSGESPALKRRGVQGAVGPGGGGGGAGGGGGGVRRAQDDRRQGPRLRRQARLHLAPAVRPCRGCAGARLRPPDGALCATTALLFHSADSEAPCREFLAKLDRADPRGGPRFSVWDEPDPAVLGDVFCSVDMLRELYAERYQRGLRRPAPDAPQGCVSIARRVPHCAVGPAGGGRARGCWARSGGGQRRRLVEWR